MAAETPPPTPGLNRWSQALQRAWLQRGPLARLLWPVAWLYGRLWALRAALYRRGVLHSTRLPLPVLVVGNVVVGGAGKTPTVIGLVKHLQQRGWHPGVISRGHGGRHRTPTQVTDRSSPAEVGDEPTLIARATGAPVMVGRHRVAAAQALMAQWPQVDIIVSDDGMQHWALHRDVTLVVFDTRGIGNGWLLPAGLLREPWPAPAWGHGPLFVLQTGGPMAGDLPPHAGAAPIYTATRRLAAHALNARGESRALVDFLHSPRLGALAGIAQPHAFFRMLQAQGLRLEHTLALPDHADATVLMQTIAGFDPHVVWLCTEKDAVKLFPALSPQTPYQVWAVPLEQTLDPALLDAIDDALAPLHGLSSRHGHQTS